MCQEFTLGDFEFWKRVASTSGNSFARDDCVVNIHFCDEEYLDKKMGGSSQEFTLGGFAVLDRGKHICLWKNISR